MQRLVGSSRQCTHSRHWGEKRVTTWSPTARSRTPSPTASTTPPPSWPSTVGEYPDGSTPEAVYRSVWHTPQATSRTSTSPARGSARSTSWTTSGAPNSSSTAARILVMVRDPIAMWVLFDLNGTLVDPAVLLDPQELAIAALDEANVMAMITVIAGAEMEFKPLLDAALRRGLERAGRDPGEAAAALEGLSRMPAFPEVAEALQRLRDGGFRLAILTQSASESAEAVLAN